MMNNSILINFFSCNNVFILEVTILKLVEPIHCSRWGRLRHRL